MLMLAIRRCGHCTNSQILLVGRTGVVGCPFYSSSGGIFVSTTPPTRGSLCMLLAFYTILYSISTWCILPVRQSWLYILQASLAPRLIAHQPDSLPSLFHHLPKLIMRGMILRIMSLDIFLHPIPIPCRLDSNQTKMPAKYGVDAAFVEVSYRVLGGVSLGTILHENKIEIHSQPTMNDGNSMISTTWTHQSKVISSSRAGKGRFSVDRTMKRCCAV